MENAQTHEQIKKVTALEKIETKRKAENMITTEENKTELTKEQLELANEIESELKELEKGTKEKSVKNINTNKELIFSTDEAQQKNFDFTKYAILKEYLKEKMRGNDTSRIKVKMKYLNDIVFNWLDKKGAIKFIDISFGYDYEKGCRAYEIEIQDIDINAKAISKAGEEFKIFSTIDIGKATKAALKQLEEEGN